MDQIATTLGRRAGSDGLAPAIASHAREQADVAEAALGGEAARHIEALRTFGQYVESRGQGDLRIVALYRLGGAVGADALDYAPGPEQATLFGRLATSGGAPAPSTTLDELVVAAIEDSLSHVAQASEQASRERDAARDEAQTAREAAGAAESAIQERDALLIEVAETRAEITSKDGQIAHLQSMIAGPARERSEPPRRKAVDGHPGVYAVERASGKVYEIGWKQDGRQRWRVVGPDLQDALAAREEMTEEVAAA